MNWQLTLVALATAPFMAVIISRFNRTVRPLFREVQQQLATLTSVLQESVAGIRVVKAFGRERHELARFDVENRGYQTINLVTIRLTAFFMPLMGFLSGLGAAFILWYGGRQIINGQLTVGELVAFNGYLLMFLGPIRFLGFLVNLYARAGAAADRIFELLDTPADVSDAPDAYELTEVAGLLRREEPGSHGYHPAREAGRTHRGRGGHGFWQDNACVSCTQVLRRGPGSRSH